MYYFNWLQKRILQIKDIWKKLRFVTLEELTRTHNIPLNIRNRIAEQYQIIVNAIPAELIQKLNQPDDEGNHTVLNVLEWYDVTKTSLKTRNIYQRLMYFKLKGFQLGYRVLENAGYEREDSNLETLKSWWMYLQASDLENKMKEFQWRISHKALYTFILLHEIDADISKRCILCKDADETIEHLFVKCAVSKQFWAWLFREFNCNTELNAKFIYLNNYETMSTLGFLITILGKYTIWEMRGILRKTELPNTATNLKINFKHRLQSHLSTLYLRHQSRSTNTFQTHYLHHDKIVIIDDQIKVRVNLR